MRSLCMYQSPPSVPVWTWRQWIAMIGGAALGASIAMAIIAVTGGVISAGLRGIGIGAMQAFLMILGGRAIKPRPQQPRRPINKPVAIFFVIIGVASVAYVVGGDLSEGRLIGERMSMMLGVLGTVFGAYPVSS